MDVEKDLRNKKIIDLHNSGATIKEIIDATGMSKSGIYKVIGSIINKEELPGKKVFELEIEGTEEIITSFSGLVRTNVNEYLNEKTGEIIRVAFVKAKIADEFGYFVKLGNSEKKIHFVDESIKFAD